MILTATRRRVGYNEDGPPYSMPTAAPCNAPVYAITPTPDRTGSAVHPSVLDFASLVPGGRWRGYRYWMGMTDFYGSNEEELENPCILQSNDGFHWRVPNGLVNPIYPHPPNVPSLRWNSDIDIEYDPVADRIVMVYRERMADLTHQFFIAASSDGVIWPAVATEVNFDRAGQQHLSPGLIRRGANDWWMFTLGRDSRKMYYYRASDPFGAWVGPQQQYWPIKPAGMPTMQPWHLDTLWDGAKFRLIMYWYAEDPVTLEWSTSAMTGASWDGNAPEWTWGGESFMDSETSGWDSGQLYRPTFTEHEDGVSYRVWYSAHSAETSWRVGYTIVPRSYWP